MTFTRLVQITLCAPVPGVGSGVAVATPLGSLSAGIGTSIGQSTGQSGAVAGPGGAALSGAFSNNGGIGVGGGFTNVLP